MTAARAEQWAWAADRYAYRCCKVRRCADPPCVYRRRSDRPCRRLRWDRPAGACRSTSDAGTGPRSSRSSCGKPLSFSTIDAMIRSSRESAQRQIRVAIHPGGIQLLAQRAVRLAQHIDIGGAADEPIGLRQKLAFRIEPWRSELIHEIRRIGRQGELDIRIAPHGLEQILHSPAIDNGERVQQYLAVHHFRQQIPRRRSGLNFIFSGLDRRREPPQASVRPPRPAAGQSRRAPPGPPRHARSSRPDSP